MEANEFETLLAKNSAILMEALQKSGDAKAMEFYTRAIFDHQELIARTLHGEQLRTLQVMHRIKEQIISDNRDRFRKVTQKLEAMEEKLDALGGNAEEGA